MENYLIDKKEVVKSNNLIESSYKLTAMEHKIIYYGSSMLNKIMLANDITISEAKKSIKLREFPILIINACDFQKAFGIKTGNIYSLLSDASSKLYDRDLIYKDEDGKIIHKRWVITSKYDSDNARIELEFHPDLLHDLLIFKDNFTILKLKDATNIKGGHAYKFYELLKQYLKFKVRVFSLEELKFILGIDDEEYQTYSSLKQNVIKPSIANINKHTDLEISFEEIKDKRKVSKLRFYISLKDKKDSLVKQIPLLDNDVPKSSKNNETVIKLQSILDYDITAGQAQKIFNFAFKSIEKNKLDIDVLDYIKDKKAIVDAYGKKNQIKSYIGILTRALQENWVVVPKQDDFNNFDQRTYDYNDLEDKLRGVDRKTPIEEEETVQINMAEMLETIRTS